MDTWVLTVEAEYAMTVAIGFSTFVGIFFLLILLADVSLMRKQCKTSSDEHKQKSSSKEGVARVAASQLSLTAAPPPSPLQLIYKSTCALTNFTLM